MNTGLTGESCGPNSMPYRWAARLDSPLFGIFLSFGFFWGKALKPFFFRGQKGGKPGFRQEESCPESGWKRA